MSELRSQREQRAGRADWSTVRLASNCGPRVRTRRPGPRDHLWYCRASRCSGNRWGAGFNPQDVIPLVPFQQFLARGLGALLDPAVLLFGATLLLPLLPRFDPDVLLDESDREQKRSRAEHNRSLLSRVDALAHQLEEIEGADRGVLHDVTKRVARAAIAPQPERSQPQCVAVDRPSGAGRDGLQEATRLKYTSDTVSAVEALVNAKTLHARARANFIYIAIGVGIVVVFIVGALVTQVGWSPILLLLAAIWVYAYLQVRQTGDLPRQLYPIAVALCGLALVGGKSYLDPRPLPEARVPPKDGRLIRARR